MSKRLLGIAVAAALITVLLGCGSKSTSAASVTTCQPDPSGEAPPRAEGQITNSSSKDSSFFVRIGFYDSSGNRVSEGADTINDVEPGTSSPFQITGGARANGPLECKVMTVRRSVTPVP